MLHPLVHPSVGLSVYWSICPSVCNHIVKIAKIYCKIMERDNIHRGKKILKGKFALKSRIVVHAVLEPGITFKKCASTMTMWRSFCTLSQVHCTEKGKIWIGKKDFRLKWGFHSIFEIFYFYGFAISAFEACIFPWNCQCIIKTETCGYSKQFAWKWDQPTSLNH